jgi:hypothetical protein
MPNETSCHHKVGYYFLRISAERFAFDLNEFSKEINSFSDEQLIGIASYSDNIEVHINIIKKELIKRVGNQFEKKSEQKAVLTLARQMQI